MLLELGSILQGGKYKIKKKLSKGIFGNLRYLAEQRITIYGSVGAVDTTLMVVINSPFLEELYSDYYHRELFNTSSNGLAKYIYNDIALLHNIAHVNNSHIVKIMDIFEEDNRFYYVEEYIDAPSLMDIIEQNLILNEGIALRYIRQIASALKDLHNINIFPSDLNPNNILIKGGEIAVITSLIDNVKYNRLICDFDSDAYGFTPTYYHPFERRMSPATNIYNLGAILFRMVVAEDPPMVDDIFDNGMPELSKGISAAVKSAIASAMQLTIRNRPQSIDEFLEILDRDEITTIIR